MTVPPVDQVVAPAPESLEAGGQVEGSGQAQTPTFGLWGAFPSGIAAGGQGRQTLQGRYPAASAAAAVRSDTRWGSVMRRAWWQVGKQ